MSSQREEEPGSTTRHKEQLLVSAETFHQILTGLTLASVSNYFSAIGSFYKTWGRTNVVEDLMSHTWSLTIANTIRPRADKRAAMNIADLQILIEATNTETFLTPLKVALTFGFLGYLRISNLSPPTIATFDNTRHSTFSDVLTKDQGLIASSGRR